MLKTKIEWPPFLGHQCWSSFNGKIPFLSVKATLILCVHADLLLSFSLFHFFSFESLKECISDVFDFFFQDRKLGWKLCFLGVVPQNYLSSCLLGYSSQFGSNQTLSYSYDVLSHFSHVQPFATLWTIAHQAPLSMGFSRQEYWSGLPCPPPGDLPDPRIKPMSLTFSAWEVGSYHECHLL